MNFTSSADAVLPWLMKCYWFTVARNIEYSEGRSFCRLIVSHQNPRTFEARHADPIKAAVIALLRSKGVEIEFTK